MLGKGRIGDSPVMLAKPQTFMNASGESVGSLVSYYKIPLNQVLLMYDDLDLPFAKLRLLPKGGHGGHNGMRSVISHLKGSRDFPRLRIGIGRPPGKMDSANFVLRPFNKKEREEVSPNLDALTFSCWILPFIGIGSSKDSSARGIQQECDIRKQFAVVRTLEQMKPIIISIRQ
uniref:peptidyl-tRNA hydrolase n=1 Tax=Ananas comosus var. bracteatus TaxID=296719 RepID=A0A6V7NXV2_ANACO|nr:unnamed protein product [Ananas comosus var. bracteatus]